MLREIALRNFKCFENLRLNCAPLTVLCGVNGMGKSSVIQAILVLRQSAISGALDKGNLVLGGDLADIGTGRDVLFEEAERDMISFELVDSDAPERCLFTFRYSRDADRLSRADQRPLAQGWRNIPPIGGNLAYVNAERIGPRKMYIQSEARLGDLGVRGEYTINHLLGRQDEVLDSKDFRCSDLLRFKLLDVLDHWLQQVTPGVHLELKAVREADAIIAGFTFDRLNDVKSRRHRTTNVGFGLSYTLPVLAALLSPIGTLCLIENPEAHLHPRGQTKLADLAVRAALTGVQVIVETHSDHFVDGIRIAVRNGLIAPDYAAFHYFERDADRMIVSSPRLDADGRLSSWPTGFFDQHEENMAKLIAPKF